MTKKKFKFSEKHNLPFFFVSAADGTNVVKVCVCVFVPRFSPVLGCPTHTLQHLTLCVCIPQMFTEAIKAAWKYKEGSKDFMTEVMELLDDVCVPCASVCTCVHALASHPHCMHASPSIMCTLLIMNRTH